MAAGGTGAAAGGAGDRVSPQCVARRCRAPRNLVPSRPEGNGLRRSQNVAIEYRSADDHLDRLPALVADLLRRQAAVLVGNHNAALAAKAATTTVPIVFATGGDPVRDHLVVSLNRPGGN